MLQGLRWAVLRAWTQSCWYMSRTSLPTHRSKSCFRNWKAWPPPLSPQIKNYLHSLILIWLESSFYDLNKVFLTVDITTESEDQRSWCRVPPSSQYRPECIIRIPDLSRLLLGCQAQVRSQQAGKSWQPIHQVPCPGGLICADMEMSIVFQECNS